MPTRSGKEFEKDDPEETAVKILDCNPAGLEEEEIEEKSDESGGRGDASTSLQSPVRMSVSQFLSSSEQSSESTAQKNSAGDIHLSFLGF